MPRGPDGGGTPVAVSGVWSAGRGIGGGAALNQVLVWTDTASVSARAGSGAFAIELADVLEGARPIRLFRDRVRVDGRDLRRLVKALEQAVAVEVALGCAFPSR